MCWPGKLLWEKRIVIHSMEDKKELNFWQDHSATFLEMAFRTDKYERVEKPDGYGSKTGICGDTVEMFISGSNGHIQTVSIMTHGCLNTNACANTVAIMAEGKTIEEAWEITPETISDYLKTLPSDHAHCAELAVGAFYLALSDLQKTTRDPWKKMYKKY
jgi:nitrogen fixation protein NifU and related proteins